MVELLAVAGVAPLSVRSSFAAAQETAVPTTQTLRIRTITAGTTIRDVSRLDAIEAAIKHLHRCRDRFVDAGYEVQTLRIALEPVIAGLDPRARADAIGHLQAMDALVADQGVIVSLGPLMTQDSEDSALPAWTAELIRRTNTISFSAAIASPEQSVHRRAVLTAARIMIELSKVAASGVGNFRFAAAANIPAGTPFFPVAWHAGDNSLAIGMESAGLVEASFAELRRPQDAEEALRQALNRALQPIERIGSEFASNTGRAWLGIDTSPAPALDRSIAAAIERLTQLPFGSGSTLAACSTITAALKSLDVKTCGYSGLMLPVLEDPLLAQRAREGRYSIRELLLYSSVCGTGLDVVPVAGDTSAETIAGVLTDVAALSARLRKPLSVRLLLVPGKAPGDEVQFNDPLLTDATVMKID
jgi:hypothetical protein